MQKGIPVETVWMGRLGSRSSEGEAERMGDGAGIVDCAEDGVVLAHRAIDAGAVLRARRS